MPPIEDLLLEAEALLARNALPEALDAFTRAHREEVRSGKALRSALGIARVELAQGKRAEAARRLDGLIKQFPSEAEPLTYRGVAAEGEGRLDEAIQFYRRATAAGPRSSVARFNLGRALGLKKLWPEAFLELVAAVKLAPDHAGYLYVLGTACQLAGKSADALEALTLCIAKAPRFFDAYVTLADVLVAAGRTEAADELLERTAMLFPSEGVVHSKRAAIAVRRGDLHAAIEHLERQVHVDSKDVEAWLSLSTFLLMTLNVEQAERALRQVLAIDPRNARAHYQLGVIFDTCRLRDEAEKAFRAAIASDPSLWRAHNNLATLLLESKKPGSEAEAIQLLEGALKSVPQAERPLPGYNLALAYWRAGRKSDSARAAREAAAGPTGMDAAENARRFLRNFEPRPKSAAQALR